MITVNTKNVRIGDVIVIDGRERKVIYKRKAWKAPEYFLTLQWTDSLKIERPFHSNKKFSKVGA